MQMVHAVSILNPEVMKQVSLKAGLLTLVSSYFEPSHITDNKLLSVYTVVILISSTITVAGTVLALNQIPY